MEQLQKIAKMANNNKGRKRKGQRDERPPEYKYKLALVSPSIADGLRGIYNFRALDTYIQVFWTGFDAWYE